MVDVLDLIPVGSERKPVTRGELEIMTGLDDRSIREAIHILKLKYPIVNIGEGYYIPDDPDDPGLAEYIRKESHRIREISRSLKKHKALYKTNKSQETMSL